MSLTSIKANEGKGKHKSMPKLKTILASPYKTRSPTLTETELQQLRNLLCEAIQKSGLEPRAFATTAHIHLGLESSLRAINSRQASGVLLSLSIKPRFLVGLVARNSEVKDETVPVYAQPKLEQFTEEVFGVRALALTLPSDVGQLSLDLEKWINSRKKPRKIKLITPKHAPIKRKQDKTKTMQTAQPAPCKEEGHLPPAQDKTWSGDFLSFSNSSYSVVTDRLKLQEDKNQLLDALMGMAEKVKSQQPTSEVTKMDTDQAESVAKDIAPAASEVVSDSDDFLQEYQSLTVHKIRPNPERKPKKKRKKNKKNK